MPVVIASDVEIEPLFFRPERRFPEMPFSDIRRGVTSRPEHRGKVRHLQGQMPRPIRHAQLRLGWHFAWDIVGEVKAGRVLAGKDGGTRGRTNGAGRVAVGETHSLRGEPVNMRRLVKRAAKTTAIRPTEIIREDKEDVGCARGLRRVGRLERGQRRK